METIRTKAAADVKKEAAGSPSPTVTWARGAV